MNLLFRFQLRRLVEFQNSCGRISLIEEGGFPMNNDLLPSTSLSFDRNIEDCIYTIRGQQVMLDSDLASLFQVEPRAINQQMKRNIERFPSDFCFQLNSNEFKTLRSQNVTFNSSTKGRKYLPYVYTEHGVMALAGVLKSDVASKMSIEIVRKFVQMRKFVLENGDVLLALAKLQKRQLEFENETNRKFEQVFRLIEKLDLPKSALFYNGEWFDAFDYIVDIIRKAKESIILIDPYCDNKALSFFKYKNDGVEILICNGPNSKLEEEEISRFESQYGAIIVKTLDDLHDRFLIIDKEECYDLGTSLNYAGKKLFAINKIDRAAVIKEIVAISEGD